MGWINRKHKETKYQLFRSIQTDGMSLWQRDRNDNNGYPLVLIVTAYAVFTLDEIELETENFV